MCDAWRQKMHEVYRDNAGDVFPDWYPTSQWLVQEEQNCPQNLTILTWKTKVNRVNKKAMRSRKRGGVKGGKEKKYIYIIYFPLFLHYLSNVWAFLRWNHSSDLKCKFLSKSWMMFLSWWHFQVSFAGYLWILLSIAKAEDSVWVKKCRGDKNVMLCIVGPFWEHRNLRFFLWNYEGWTNKFFYHFINCLLCPKIHILESLDFLTLLSIPVAHKRHCSLIPSFFLIPYTSYPLAHNYFAYAKNSALILPVPISVVRGMFSEHLTSPFVRFFVHRTPSCCSFWYENNNIVLIFFRTNIVLCNWTSYTEGSNP